MKQSTANKYIKILNKVKDSGESISNYFKENKDLNIGTLRSYIRNIRERGYRDSLDEELLNLYNSLIKSNSKEIDTDDRAKVWEERDENGLIKYYCFEIYKRDKAPLVGKLGRIEMESIYRLYSYYGASLTQRQVSRLFPEYSLVDFKRILRAFNITKANSPFPKHMLEEKTNEELQEIHLREKENDFLRKIEQTRLKDTEALLNKYAKENYELKEQLKNIKGIDFNYTIDQPIITSPTNITSPNSIMLHLSDLHIGARVENECIYPNEWNEKELHRRLEAIINKVCNLGGFDTIVVNLLGDMIDGIDQMTCRKDHILPQNMGNMEQIKTFMKEVEWTLLNLRKICNHLKVYSVNCGNHAGITEYAAVSALFYKLSSISDIECTLFDQFFGYYEFNEQKWVLLHGKDAQYMKRPFPLNLNDDTKIKIYDWLDSQGIYGNNIHIIKGDLHSENINSCNKLDYRNVLSLFGASDYSSSNYQRNQYGCSFELFTGNQMTRGTFENI